MTDWSKVELGARVRVYYTQTNCKERIFLQRGTDINHATLCPTNLIVVYDADSWNREIVLQDQVKLIDNKEK